MKVTTRHTAAVKLLAAVVLATSVFVATVNAQPSFQGRFTLPYEVHWGNAVLPAGAYTITMPPFEAAALVRSASGKAQFIPFASTEDSKQGVSCLFIAVRGDEHRVLSLNLAQFGQSLIYERLTKTERETLAKADQIQAVPVLTARK